MFSFVAQRIIPASLTGTGICLQQSNESSFPGDPACNLRFLRCLPHNNYVQQSWWVPYNQSSTFDGYLVRTYGLGTFKANSCSIWHSLGNRKIAYDKSCHVFEDPLERGGVSGAPSLFSESFSRQLGVKKLGVVGLHQKQPRMTKDYNLQPKKGRTIPPDDLPETGTPGQ